MSKISVRSEVSTAILDSTSDILTSVENVAFAAANVKAKPSPWTKSLFKLYLCLVIPFSISCINGFDGQVMGGINSYKIYREYFGFDPDKGTPGNGIVYAIFPIGSIVGSFVTGPAADFKGRKWGMFAGALILLVFAAVQATSVHLAQFMVARFMLGFGLAVCGAGPVYVSEMAHPSYRGVITSLYNAFYMIGAVPGTFIPYGTSTINSNSSWRIPLWCQMFFAGIVVLGSPFLPESPRWLIANNRHAEALDVLAKYHGDGNRDSPIVQLEYKEMVEDISTAGSDKRWWDYRALFNSREVRYRSMLVIAMGFIGQWAGNGPVSYYYPQMLAGAGITNNRLSLFLNGMQTVVSFVGAVFGSVFTDKWGRRPQLLVGTALFVVIFVIITPLNATNLYRDATGTLQAERPSQARALIAMVFIFGFVFSSTYTPLQILYPVECLSFESRAKGMGMYNVFVQIASFYNTFVTEIAFSGAGWRYYFLFIFWNMLAVAFIYKFFVETRKRTLEELTEIFRSQYPVRTSLAKSQIVIRGDEIITHAVDKVVW